MAGAFFSVSSGEGGNNSFFVEGVWGGQGKPWEKKKIFFKILLGGGGGNGDPTPHPPFGRADPLPFELFPPVRRSPLTGLVPVSYSRVSFLNLVEGGGFEPPKSHDDRFTVCSLWPLGNPSITIL